jgi:hypothetical protein
MGEQDRPTIADPFMKVNGSFSCLRREIRRLIAYA